MSRLTAVVVVTHGNAGADMIDAAQAFLRLQIPHIRAVSIDFSDAKEAVDAKIDDAVSALGVHGDDDILFLVDLVGSTPARLCCRKCGGQPHVVTGLNMPMLLKLATSDRTLGATALGTELVKTGTKSIHCE